MPTRKCALPRFGAYLLVLVSALVTMALLLNGCGSTVTIIRVVTATGRPMTPTPTPVITCTGAFVDAHPNLIPQQAQQLLNLCTDGQPNFADPLTGADANSWENFQIPDATSCFFRDSAYHAVAEQKNYVALCFEHALTFSNFVFETEMQVIAGDGGGLIFRLNGADYTAPQYRFRVGADQTYDVTEYLHGQGTGHRIVTGKNPAIDKGVGASNLLSVVALGSHIYVFANGVYIASITNTTSPTGELGFFAADYSHPTDIAFSNMDVWSIS
ncbi:MAG TPA: hypothetical protein VKQ36_03270 [Ktedonobacterales bacterium]|nr:hypothetical protein [Ktedonobacterales bacterium]